MTTRKTDLHRLKALPRKIKPTRKAVDDLIDKLYLPNKTREIELFPIQREALWEAANNRPKGFVGLIEVGGGKTWTAILLPTVLKKNKALIMTTNAKLKRAMYAEIEFMRQHFHLADEIQVWTYAELSRKENHGKLDEYAPDCIVCDEAHYLANMDDSARTPLMMSHVNEQRIIHNRAVSFCATSGTLIERGIDRWAHILFAAFGPDAPAPRDYYIKQMWAQTLDVKTTAEQVKNGAYVCKWLADLVPPTKRASGGLVTSIRQGFRQLLTNTPGVVISGASEVKAKLIIQKVKPEIPSGVSAALKELEEYWARPDGEYLNSPLEVAAVRQQLCSGFYYVWDWDKVEAGDEWQEARLKYAKLLRDLRGKTIKSVSGAKRKLLTLGQVDEYVRQSLQNNAVLIEWQRWEHLPPPPVKVIWLDTYLVDWAEEWAKDNPDSLIFATHRATRAEMSKRSTWKYVPGNKVPDLSGSGVQAVSTKSHGTGLNLQKYERGLLLEPPTTNRDMEQVIGRLHRNGTKADKVMWDVAVHGAYARNFSSALADAKYVEEMTGLIPKMRKATIKG